MRKLMLLAVFLILSMVSSNVETCDRYPTLQINGIYYSVDCLCVDGNIIRPRDQSRQVSMPIATTERICKAWDSRPEHGGECLAWETIKIKCPLTYTIRSYEMMNETEFLTGTKSFTIPKCGSQ